MFETYYLLIDGRGRLTIPAACRALHALGQGKACSLTDLGDGIFLLAPVVSGEGDLTVDEILAALQGLLHEFAQLRMGKAAGRSSAS